MAVFYIRERNAFYSWLTLNHISPTAQALWNALFTIYNAQGWPDEWLEVPESLLCSYMHVGKQALYDARNQLKNKGLLDFQKGNRNKQAVKYRPIWLSPRDEETDETCEVSAPSFPPGFPQDYPQRPETSEIAGEKAPCWSENQTKELTNTETNNNTNQQTNSRTITPPLDKTTKDKENNILNNTTKPEGKTAAVMSLPHTCQHTKSLPPVQLNLRHYLQWWDEIDEAGQWKSGFQTFLATDGQRYTQQMLNCALTITQNKHDRHLIRNPLEYCKQTLIDWGRRGLTSRAEIEQYLDVNPTTGGYYAGLAWEHDHEPYEYA